MQSYHVLRTTSRRPALWVILVALLAGCSREQGDAGASPDASEAFRRFLADNYAEDMRQFPATASLRGIKDDSRDWNPLSDAFLDRRRALEEARLARLREFDRERLSVPDRLSWQLYEQELERNLRADDFRHHHYVIHNYSGHHTAVPSFLVNVHKVGSVADAEDYIARLERVAPLFEQVVERMALAAEKGIFLPDWAYPRIIETARNTIAGAPFGEGPDSVIWADFTAKIAALDIPEARRDSLRDRAETAMLDSVRRGYRGLIAEAERLRAMAPARDGVWKHPDGDAFYAERLRYFTTTDLSAEEIHAIGLREVARIHDEMRGIVEQVGFEGDLRQFMTFMREDPRFYYADDAEGRARYLAEAGAMIDAMRERLPEAFGILPRAELVVKRVEPFREKSAGKAFYQYPAADGSRPGIYYANLYDMKSMPIYQMEALAYHEGVPGHHMQLGINVELEAVPDFQKYATFTAYTEGWGLYSEFLPKEMGFYRDPYSDFGRLAMELWRAARLVVDTGIHRKRWTRERAIQYLVDNTPNAEHDAVQSIERYAAMPGQATAYLIGKNRILELRERAKANLGERFDLRGFHDEVLKDGPVPLSILEQKIDRWEAGLGAG